jgi:serine/threonine-protein kinase
LSAKVSATKVCPGCSARYPPDALFCPNDGCPLTSTPPGDAPPDAGPGNRGEGHDSYLGREISGHIEIRKLAGVGAMGRVYRAFQKGIERDVAVKVLHRELSANQQLVARFHREAKVASRLQHPNVVQVHLAGQLPDGAMFIVMEYLDGLSLQSALAAMGGPLPLERALHIGLQICDAVGEAHSQGVVHRDIKPENVMLVRRGDDPDFVKVLDFGIARLNWGEQSMATAAGLIFGTARYISPEGAQGEAVGPEGDVYATATLLYQMLAGRTPFEGEQAVALLVQQIHDTPPPIRSISAAASVPEAVASVIMTNLSKSPRDRAPDARTFGRALVEAAKTVGLSPEDLVPRSNLFTSQSRRSVPSVAAGTPAPPEAVAPAPAPVPRSAKHDDATPRPAPFRSSVDPTLDDSSPVKVPPAPSPDLPISPVRTEPGFPSPSAQYLATPTPQIVASAQPLHTPPGVSHAAGATQAMPAPPGDLAPDARRPAHTPTEPARSSRLWVVLLACFLVGTVGASLGLRQLGWLRGAPRTALLDSAVVRADDALKHGRWDAPPGDNVRDITTDALSRWPRDPRLLDLRARATDELVKEAVGRKFAGDLPAALHLARLANELDPTDTTAQHLVDEYERASRDVAVDAAPVSLPLPSPGSPPRHGAAARTPGGAASAAKVAMDSSLPHPKVGQPVTFTAKVSVPSGQPKAVEDARFVINGPGLAPDTRLGTLAEAGAAYSATFAGFEPGKYEVTFDAKVDGVAVRAVKALVIDGGTPAPSASAPPPPLPSASTRPLPSTVPSGKWL